VAAPAPPPATTIVVEGSKTEREQQLEKELSEALDARRKAETDAAYALDEARRLKDLQSRPDPKPRAQKKSGWTLLHEEED